ncbi:MAG: THUMP domain-containing protein, partial [Thermoplasmata archaeon]
MIIIRYDEIGLKGKNRIFFEKMLMKNIENQLKKIGYESKVYRIRGRIVIESDAPIEIYKKIFGIRSFSPAYQSSLDINDIYNLIKSLISNKKFETFRISAQRLWKNYEYTSVQINEILGEYIIMDFN